MPLYDFRCECGNTEEVAKTIATRDEYEPCRRCRLPMKRLFPFLGQARVQVFEAQYFEHLGTEPVWVNSRRDLKRKCDEKGVTSVHLANSGIPL